MNKAQLIPKGNYPPYIKIEDDEDTGPKICIWTRTDALILAHNLMKLAHELQREIDKND